MTTQSVFQNEGRWHIEAQCDLGSDASAGAVRGTNCTFTKTGTGAYTLKVKGTTALKVYEVLHGQAALVGASPATAFNARVTGVTQATDGTDDVSITLVTLTNAATPAAADTTAAITLSVNVVLRVIRMGNPL